VGPLRQDKGSLAEKGEAIDVPKPTHRGHGRFSPGRPHASTAPRWASGAVALLLSLALVVLSAGPTPALAAAGGPITLVVNGAIIPCDVPPVNIGGRILVPVRFLAEALNYQVNYIQAENRIVITSGTGTAPAGLITALDVSRLVEVTSPSVVGIVSFHRVRDEYGRDVESFAFGSGFVYRSDGWIVTNDHVIRGASRLMIILSDGRSYEVPSLDMVVSDQLSDVALLRVPLEGLPALPLADIEKVRVGEPVIAIGSPGSFRLRNTVTAGIVSGLGRGLGELYRFIQTDAAINPGNSGGPLLNARGEVIGMTSLKIGGGYEGLGFAVPADVIASIVAELVEHGRVIRPWLGATLEESWEAFYGLPSTTGLLVVEVHPASPAARAGLRPGDYIWAIDGRRTDTMEEVAAALWSHAIGDTAVLSIRRLGTNLELRVVLDMERPSDQ